MTTVPKPWNDTTSYSQSESRTPRAERTPRTWEHPSKELRLVVTRMHKLDGWWMHAYCVGFDRVELKSEDPEDAKAEATAILRRHLEKLLEAVE